MNEIQNQISQTPVEIALGIDEQGMTTARKLYAFLEMDKSQYARWYKTNILENPFAIENEDYEVLDINVENSKGGRPSQNFKLSANFAKKLSMQGKTEKAEQARDYFIAVENKLKEVAKAGISHNTRQLAITSREIAKIASKRHSWVLRGIRERIADLQEVGFDTSQFYSESAYMTIGKNIAPQYLCTEQGCEDFSRCLEPDKRKVFLQEFPDRFERMRNVLEGKPVKKLPKLICLADVQEKEPYARLYKTDTGGIVLMNDMVFNLASSEMEHLSRFVSELEKQDIEHIEYVVSSFLKSMKKSRKLEEIASWGVKA